MPASSQVIGVLPFSWSLINNFYPENRGTIPRGGVSLEATSICSEGGESSSGNGHVQLIFLNLFFPGLSQY